MEEKYNGLTKALLLFQKEGGCELVPVANLQPGYGPWENKEAAYAGLVEVFEDIANVPAEYTFCILDENNKPKEWWFIEKGNWETIAPKSLGESIEAILLFQYNPTTQSLMVSYDGGKTWTNMVTIPTMEGNYVTEVRFNPNTGQLEISYDNGLTWDIIGQIKFEITNTGYFRYTFDGGTTWFKLPIYAVSSSNPGGGDEGGGPIEEITTENIGSIDFQNSNESSPGTYTGQDACDILIYMATDYPNQMITYMESRYPNVPVGSYIIVRSTLYDRTGGMSNASDETHTYELDPAWTTADVLENNSQSDWYHYYKITKVDIGKWAGVAWIGRIPAFEDAVRHTITIGTIVPSEAEVTVTYNDMEYRNLHTGSTIIVDDGATIDVHAEAEGFQDFDTTLTNITADQTVNIVCPQAVETVKVYFIVPSYCDGAFRIKSASKNYKTEYLAPYGSLGRDDDVYVRTYDFPKGETIKVYYCTDDPTYCCFNIAAWDLSEGTSTVGEHPSRVYLKKGLNVDSWKSYTLYKDTVINASFIQNRSDVGAGAGPSLPQDKILLCLERYRCYGDASGTYDVPIDETGHVELEYTITYGYGTVRTETHTISDLTERFVFIKGDLDDYPNGKVTVTAHVVGASVPYGEYTSTFDYNLGSVHSIEFVPAGWYELSFGEWDPSNLTLDMNSTQVYSANKYRPRYYTPDTNFSLTASCRYYVTKHWTDIMPEADYQMPNIKLREE